MYTFTCICWEISIMSSLLIFFHIFYIFPEFCFLLLLANEIDMLRSPYNNLVQLRSIAQLCLTLCDSMDCSTPGFPVLHYLPELFKVMSIESVMPSNHLILCHPLLLLPSSFPSIRVFSNWVSSSHQVANVLELQLQHQSFQGIVRIDFLYNWLFWSPCCPRDSQESSPTQFKSINSSVLSFLYGPNLTSYMTTGKTIALTTWTFVSKVMSLLFNKVSRFVIAFLPRSKYLLISWLLTNKYLCIMNNWDLS